MSLNQIAESKNETVSANRAMALEVKERFLIESQEFEMLERKAQIMSSSVATIPKHLQGNAGDCMAIIMMANAWGMLPHAVAQKTHLINGVMGFEAQLINAVVSSSRKIVGSFHYEWYGDWSKIIGKVKAIKNQTTGKEYLAPNWNYADEGGLGIRVSATLNGETEPRVLDLLLLQAQVRNSTLWASDPKQQLAYLGVKRWSRLYAPDVILGVYSPDELMEREINPVTSAPSKANGGNTINHGDTALLDSLVSEIETAVSLKELDELKPSLSSAGKLLNKAQIDFLSQSYKGQAKFIMETAAAEIEAATADSKTETE